MERPEYAGLEIPAEEETERKGITDIADLSPIRDNVEALKELR